MVVVVFPSPSGGRGDGGHIDVFAVRNGLQAFENFKLDLGFVRTVKFKLVWQDAEFLGNGLDGFKGGLLGNFDIRRDRIHPL